MIEVDMKIRKLGLKAEINNIVIESLSETDPSTKLSRVLVSCYSRALATLVVFVPLVLVPLVALSILLFLYKVLVYALAAKTRITVKFTVRTQSIAISRVDNAMFSCNTNPNKLLYRRYYPSYRYTIVSRFVIDLQHRPAADIRNSVTLTV